MNAQLEAANRQIAASHATSVLVAVISNTSQPVDVSESFNELFDTIFAKMSGDKTVADKPLTGE